MIKLEATTSTTKIQDWLSKDEFHQDERHSPDFLLTGNGLLSFTLVDDKGPVCFIRLDKEDDLCRIAIQFGPVEEVSRRRLALGLHLVGIPAMIQTAKNNNLKGLVFESISPDLIRFGERHGFQAVGDNDYVLKFEVENV